MPKFYVKSGELRVVLVAKNPFDACCRAINSIRHTISCGLTFDVNRRGFESPPELSFDVETIAEAAGWEWE